MCSGCSGDFEADSDDREFGGSEPQESELGGREALAQEAGITGWGRIGLPNRITDVGDYEVLVSDERIVERRTIRAKYPAISSKAVWQADETWRGRQRESEQSVGTTAKYYRTSENSRFAGWRKCFGDGKCLMWCYLAWLAALAVTLWLAVE